MPKVTEKPVDLVLIRDMRSCCADVPAADSVIGVTVFHTEPGEGTRHELDLFWKDAPEGGRQVAEPSSMDPLTLPGELTCACGWSGTVG